MYERIVSLAPSNTEILYALGVGDRVVATTSICDHPDAVGEVPGIGGWTNPDIAAVKEHDPDLVLASDELQDEAVKRCRDAGLPVKQFTPVRLHDVFNTIKMIGEIVSEEERARDLVEEMNEAVRDHAATGSGRIYCEEWGEPPMAAGNWVPDMIELVGAASLLSPGERSRAVTAEEVQAFDPDHIVLHYCGYGDSPNTQNITERDGWAQLSAVAAGNVHVVDDALLNRPGPRLIEGVAALAEITR